ncbi:PASTA domain-containing protein, partial [Breznakia sp. OttesenSCG-928-G09]|nr:PASTA domain-containing protein [Breznakia sp. OttesenSCG-928-G09]
YQKKKIIQHGLLVLAILLVFVGGFLVYRFMNERTLPNFVDKPISEMQEWSKKNGVDLDISTEFSMKHDSDHVISVNKKAGSSVQKGDLLIVKVSEGADPEELLEIPDFASYNESKINDWISENRADNLKVQKEYSKTVKKGDFIRLEFADKDMTRKAYKRKDYATVTVSKGEAKKTIEVPDFSGKEVAEAVEWGKKNEVKIIQKEEYSESVEAGKVISQSISSKEKVAKGNELTIAVSKGKAQIVPNFSMFTLYTINEIGEKEGVPFLVVERYNAGVPYGQFISQDIAPGTIIENENVSNVVVTYSIGNPYINRSDVIYKTEKELRDYFYEMNQKGANITYKIQHVAPNTCQFKDQPIEKGITCGANYNNQFIEIGSTITIYMANADLNN